MFQKGQKKTFSGLVLFFAAAVGLQLATAQITTTGLHGIVKDPTGAVVPNANIKLKDVATGIEKATVAGTEGTFIFANIVAGTYQITASATGFQTGVVNNIVVDTGRITDVTVALKVGAITETVEVSGGTVPLETTSNEIGTTINNNEIQNLPYFSRDSLMFSLYMAGNSTANDSSGRNSTFNGLPNASLNISIDGMNNNSQRFKSGGTSMYAFAPERIDAMDEVTVSTTGMGAEAAAQGAMSIRFTTKRGTDQYHFSVGEQFANEDLNSNSFFNNLRGQPIPRSRQNNPYGSVSGRLLPFIPALSHKLFFFAYFEAQPQPTTTVLTTTVLTPGTQAGNFTYIGTDGQTRTVNLLQAAAGAGLPSAIDPTISGILGAINSSETHSSGYLNISGQPYWQTMEWNQGMNTLYLFPTARVDYQITPKVAWHGTWNLRYENIAGYPNYPGMTQYDYGNAYKITTYIGTNAVDWQITPHMQNSAVFGVQSNGEYFYQGSNPQQWSIYGNRNISFPFGTINPAVVNQTPFIRNNPVFQLNDDVTWVKGRHNITFGGTVLHTSFYETSYGSAGVPSYNLGLPSSDPAAAAIQAALPFINTGNGDLTNAQNIYALLTGRLSSITGSENVSEITHQYNQFAPITQRYAFTTGGIYIQDNFRITPQLTLNYGLRWELDGPIHNTNGIDSEPTGANFFGPSNGLFQPGVLSGNNNPVLTSVSNPYSSSLHNFAPNLGFAWNPSGKQGFLGKLLGDGKTVIRGSYSLTYYNEGMNAISNVLSSNQGTTQSISSVPGGPGFPLSGLNLTSPAPTLQVFPASFGFPLPESDFVFAGRNSTYLVNPNLVTPYVNNWNLGIQRELPNKTVLEVRYIGNKATHLWHYQNLNEVNIFENGFLTEFQNAQNNLAIANGIGVAQLPTANLTVRNFSNQGLPGQKPLPILQTAFGANGSQGALSTSQGFGSSTFVTDVAQGQAGAMAGTLASTGSTTYYCRLVGSNFAPCAAQGFTAASQYPLNFFTPNPYATSLNYQSDDGNTNYNSLQVEVRKSFSHGLMGAANFTWSHGLGDLLNASDQTATYQWFTQRNAALSYGPSPFDRRLVFNSYWTYDLPLGKGKPVNIANPVLNRVVGGWTIGGTETIASGNPLLVNSGRDTFNNLVQGGVVLGSGLTQNQLQQDLTSIPNMNQTINGNLISNVASVAQSNGIANPAFYGPATTPGAFSQFVYLRNTTNFILNMSLNKEILIHDRLNVGFRLEALNFLNHPFFALGNNTVTTNTFGQVSSTFSASTNGNFNRVVLLRAYMSW